MNSSVLDGADLILSVATKAIGFSSGCKVSTSVETGERATKETSASKWANKFVKKFSESITADGLVLTDGDATTPTYDALKALMLAGVPIEAQYSIRDGDLRTGKTTGGYKGNYIITALDIDAQVGNDTKYSITLENSGPVDIVGTGLTDAVG